MKTATFLTVSAICFVAFLCPELHAGSRRVPGEGTGTDYGVGVSMEIEVAGQRGIRVTEAERNLQKAEAGFQDFARTLRADSPEHSIRLSPLVNASLSNEGSRS